jgi:hypothetical protein
VLRDDDKIDADATVTLYLFLPVTHEGTSYRSSLEALLRDARGATGRDLGDGSVKHADHSRSFLGAMGYLALVDQMSKAIDPGAPRRAGPLQGGNAFETLLLRVTNVTPDEAAALYALRCSFVHQYGLLNDGHQRRRKNESSDEKVKREKRIVSLRHMFQLGADGGGLIALGNRRITPDTPMSKIDPTFVDLRTLADTAEQLVEAIRLHHLATSRVKLKSSVRLQDFVRACFFMHRDEIDLKPAADGPFVPKSAGASMSLVNVDTSSRGVSGFNPFDSEGG